ncbi:MAG TPA: ImmA/IrrE family metallo-endopeptidase [Anaerolineales bacterium]|nr:ImmA/IrrE family metallo-endopeptidase [Anaerolineales bacterium]
MGYEDPAHLYIERHGNVADVSDLIAYADFLRKESGITDDPPINLNAISLRFGIPVPQAARLKDQQGALVSTSDGIPQILVKADDSRYRQRFTHAHELMEFLFLDSPGDVKIEYSKPTIFRGAKERVCQVGAAHLLMPQSTFRPQAITLGLSFHSAEKLAGIFEVSFMASLFRLIDQYENEAALILWKMKNKPKEIRNKISDKQLQIPGFEGSFLSKPQLRVEWSYGTINSVFIPRDKSIQEESSTYKTWETGNYSLAPEPFPFGKLNSKAIFENKTIAVDGETFVLSLITCNASVRKISDAIIPTIL